MKLQTPHVTRIVLDTNYFRALKPEQLQPLRDRGFKISISMSAFHEVWARAVREGKLGPFIGSAVRLRDVIDRTLPIAPASGHFAARFRRPTPTDDFIPHYRAQWELVSRRQGDEDSIRSQGLKVNDFIDDYAENWTGLAARWEPGADRETFAAMTHKLRRHLIVEHLAGSSVDHGYRVDLRERWHAYQHVTAHHLWETARGAKVATVNDAEDLRLLHHLGEPAFLLTWDQKLREAVDKSGSFQASWVRTLGEMRADAPPPGLPWNKNARRAHRSFSRRSQEDLVKLEATVRPL